MKTFLSVCFALACWFFWEEGGKWVFLTVSLIYFLISLDKSERYSAELEGRMEDAENNISDLYEKSDDEPSAISIHKLSEELEHKIKLIDPKIQLDGIARWNNQMDSKYNALEEMIVAQKMQARENQHNLQEEINYLNTRLDHADKQLAKLNMENRE